MGTSTAAVVATVLIIPTHLEKPEKIETMKYLYILNIVKKQNKN
jgi:hypothetical protein